MITTDEVTRSLPRPGGILTLPAPPFTFPPERVSLGSHVALAVSSMKDHMTDEGWQIMLGLEIAGYNVWGHRCPYDSVNVPSILEVERPQVVVLQDKREWDVPDGNFRDPAARFRGVRALRDRRDVFKLTILKDCQHRPDYHRHSADEIGCHAWVVYYHPKIVAHLCPYVRPQHLIRTYHTIDRGIVEPYSPAGRDGCLLSGAVGGAYPLRSRLFQEADRLPRATALRHPGYHRAGCQTPAFLATLSRFKVAICTASRFGYALRKIIEATAAGCVVVTDLPSDEVMPGIDGNLVRVRPDFTTRQISNMLRELLDKYDPAKQRYYAGEATAVYDYRVEGLRLAAAIDDLRDRYDTERR